MATPAPPSSGPGAASHPPANGGDEVESSKPVWNKPSHSYAEAEATPVMGGGVVWPALSQSTNTSQGTGMFSPSLHLEGVGSDVNTGANANHAVPARQRTNRRVDGGGGGNLSNSVSSNRGFSQGVRPRGVEGELGPDNAGETSGKEKIHREGGGQRGGPGSQSRGGGEHQQRSSYRRGGSGSHLRDGGRRDHDRGNPDWNPHRNAQMHPQRGSPRPFFRGPSHAHTPYIPPPPIAVRPPFVGPMIYPGPEMQAPLFYAPGPHMDPYRGVPLVSPIGPVYFPFGDPHLHMKIVNQIEYYFSNANIVKDTYLRRNMDEQGWVPIKLIAGFNKVSELTDDVQLILTALQSSSLLEVEGEKLRRREDWPNWIIPHSAQHSATSSPLSTPKSGHGMLADHLQSLALNDANIPSRSSSGEFSSR